MGSEGCHTVKLFLFNFFTFIVCVFLITLCVFDMFAQRNFDAIVVDCSISVISLMITIVDLLGPLGPLIRISGGHKWSTKGCFFLTFGLVHLGHYWDTRTSLFAETFFWGGIVVICCGIFCFLMKLLKVQESQPLFVHCCTNAEGRRLLSRMHLIEESDDSDVENWPRYQSPSFAA
eukprot:TRINITY_DN14730_c0_g1_i1.p1 TRINITY_DN14730_c0_g1~~TRINITY_DN14730_c0_g1_i1.p1  ORF type:complete len:185 (-),score=10.38 TRINITY_DN14730_c0_g1_i1:26-553(-)